MALRRNAPLLAAVTVGIATGFYAFNQPLKQYSEDHGLGGDPRRSGSDGQSQVGGKGKGTSSPHPALHSGGASPNNPLTPTVVGTTESGRRGNSGDPNASIRSKEDAKTQDGTKGGGMGVSEMRERKEKGQGLPSPQGGDTKAQPVQSVAASGEGGGLSRKATTPSSDTFSKS